MLNNKTIEQKRKERKKISAEDFTPEFLVQDILNKLLEYNPNALNADQTILDPACGNGNMIFEALKYRLKAGVHPLQAISTLYGTDIMKDNVQECHERLLGLIKDKLTDKDLNTAIETICQHVIVTPLSKYKNGSLDYDFEFNKKPNHNYVKKIKKIIFNQQLTKQQQDAQQFDEDTVSFPTIETNIKKSTNDRQILDLW